MRLIWIIDKYLGMFFCINLFNSKNKQQNKMLLIGVNFIVFQCRLLFYAAICT